MDDDVQISSRVLNCIAQLKHSQSVTKAQATALKVAMFGQSLAFVAAFRVLNLTGDLADFVDTMLTLQFSVPMARCDLESFGMAFLQQLAVVDTGNFVSRVAEPSSHDVELQTQRRQLHQQQDFVALNRQLLTTTNAFDERQVNDIFANAQTTVTARRDAGFRLPDASVSKSIVNSVAQFEQPSNVVLGAPMVDARATVTSPRVAAFVHGSATLAGFSAKAVVEAERQRAEAEATACRHSDTGVGGARVVAAAVAPSARSGAVARAASFLERVQRALGGAAFSEFLGTLEEHQRSRDSTIGGTAERLSALLVAHKQAALVAELAHWLPRGAAAQRESGASPPRSLAARLARSMGAQQFELASSDEQRESDLVQLLTTSNSADTAGVGGGGGGGGSGGGAQTRQHELAALLQRVQADRGGAELQAHAEALVQAARMSEQSDAFLQVMREFAAGTLDRKGAAERYVDLFGGATLECSIFKSVFRTLRARATK